MKRTRQVISFALVIAFAGLGLIATAHAQQRTYRWNDRQMQQLLARIDMRANRFSSSLDKALDRSRLDGTKREDDINTLLTDFKNSTDQLHQRFNNRQSTMTDAEMVLRQGALLNSFMQRHQVANGVERQWTMLRNDLSQLASARLELGQSARVDSTGPVSRIRRHADRHIPSRHGAQPEHA